MRQHKQTLALMVGQILALTSALPCPGADASLQPTDLRCEGLVNPLGIDTVQPRLSWRLESVKPNDRGQRQTAYQIRVASCRKAVGWGASGPVGQRTRRVGPVAVCPVPGWVTDVAQRMLVDGPDLGCAEQRVGLECAGRVVHGTAGGCGLVRCRMDRL